jgi:hypothetical protein
MELKPIIEYLKNNEGVEKTLHQWNKEINETGYKRFGKHQLAFAFCVLKKQKKFIVEKKNHCVYCFYKTH